MSYIIALRSLLDESYVGFFDGDPSTWASDGIRARRFDDEDVAQQTAYYLRQRFPQVASYIHMVAGEAVAPRSPCALKRQNLPVETSTAGLPLGW